MKKLDIYLSHIQPDVNSARDGWESLAAVYRESRWIFEDMGILPDEVTWERMPEFWTWSLIMSAVIEVDDSAPFTENGVVIVSYSGMRWLSIDPGM